MNIYNQNIGQNYRGILNLDATTINTPLDATLRAVTDGMGTSSLLQLSTEAVGLSRTVNLAAGATTPRLFNVAYTINNSGAQTGTLTGLFLNATETALNGIIHNLIDLQVGGVSKFNVLKAQTRIGTYIAIDHDNNRISNWQGGSTPIEIWNNNFSTKNIGFSNGVGNYYTVLFQRLQLEGVTSSFPMIKRNGAAIDFRLADDSGYCAVNVGTLTTNGIANINTARMFNINDSNNFVTALNIAASTGNLSFFTSSLFAASGTINASARVQIDSTTQGFLMPRMTEAQILAIAAPANGLMVYNTNQLAPCFYDGTGWKRVVHLAM